MLATSALAYSHIVLRGISRSSLVLKNIVTHLTNLITKALTAPPDDYTSDPAMLSWAFLIGVLASPRDSTEGHWFMLCLQQACKDTCLDWEKVRSMIDAPTRYSTAYHWVLEDCVLEIEHISTTINL